MVAGNQGLTANLTMAGGTFSSTGGGGFNIDPSAANAPSINTIANATTALISANVVNRSATVSLPFNVASGTTASGSDLTVSGVISGGGITKNGAGALTLTNTNTYTGGTSITAGTLLTTTTGGTLGTGNVVLSNTGALTLGNAATIASTATLTFARHDHHYFEQHLDRYPDGYHGDGQCVHARQWHLYRLSVGHRLRRLLLYGAGSLTVVPEPATWLGGLVLVGGAFGFARRRKMGARLG